MTEPPIPDERLFPAKVIAAVVSLLVMIGFFIIAVQRGPNDFYEYLMGAATAGLAVAIVTALIRWHRRLRRTGPGSRGRGPDA